MEKLNYLTFLNILIWNTKMCKEKAGYYSNRVRTLGQVQTSFIV
jgi:hypothetical protein